MKKIIIAIVAILTVVGMAGCGNVAKESKDAATLLREVKTTQYFADDEVVTIIE